MGRRASLRSSGGARERADSRSSSSDVSSKGRRKRQAGSEDEPRRSSKRVRVAEAATHRAVVDAASVAVPLPAQAFQPELPVPASWEQVLANAKPSGRPADVVMLLGARNAGKSSLARLLVNAYLQHGARGVVYVDTDVGQCELTPSGCVSVHTLTQALPLPGQAPVLQPMTAHRVCLFGAPTPKQDPALMYRCLVELHQSWSELDRRHMPTVINTHGWIKSLGLDILRNVAELWQPSVVLALGMDSVPLDVAPSSASATPLSASASASLPMLAQVEALPWDSGRAASTRESVPMLREQQVARALTPLQYTYTVPRRDVSVRYAVMHAVTPSLLLHAIIGTVVVLAHDPAPLATTTRRLLDQAGECELAMFAGDYSQLHVLGFGVVWGVSGTDVTVVTACAPQQMQHVNTVVRARHPLPQSVWQGVLDSGLVSRFADAPYLTDLDVQRRGAGSNIPTHRVRGQA